MKIESRIWGKTPDGKEIVLYTITNESGASVSLSSVGAGIVSVNVPDKDGKLADVVIGYDDPMSFSETAHVRENAREGMRTESQKDISLSTEKNIHCR